MHGRKESHMEKISSFTVNHLALLPGIYVSRKDPVGMEIVTTFDLRLTRPNFEPVLNTAEVHTIEHLGATYLRSEPEWKDRILYFGPMGCRTGFYLIIKGDLASRDVISLVTDTFRFIAEYKGAVPGAAPEECGNYLDMNLPMANFVAKRYVKDVLEQITEDRLKYPQ